MHENTPSLANPDSNQPNKWDNLERTTDEDLQAKRATARELGKRTINGIGNYEFPPIISEEEARHWQTMNIPHTGLYKSFDEIFTNRPQQLADTVNHLENIYWEMGDDPEEDYYMEEAALAYATVAAYMDFHELYDKSLIQEGIKNNKKDEWRKFLLFDHEIDAELVEKLPEKYDPTTEAITLSSALHLLHQRDPDIHDLAVSKEAHLKEKLAGEKGIDLDLERIIFLNAASNDFLTGKSAFPSYLVPLVEKKLSTWKDDLAIDYSVTWANSHLDDPYYDYSIPESPQITLQAISPEVLDLAEKALYSISQEDIDKAQSQFQTTTDNP